MRKQRSWHDIHTARSSFAEQCAVRYALQAAFCWMIGLGAEFRGGIYAGIVRRHQYQQSSSILAF